MPAVKRCLIALLLMPPLSFAFDKHVNELGLGVGWTHIPGEKKGSPSVHLHYVMNVSKSIGAGIGYEQVFDRHGHKTASLLLTYRLKETVVFSYMIGAYLEGGSGLSNHVEVAKLFQIKGLHIGPFAGISFGEETHFKLGIHAGFGF